METYLLQTQEDLFPFCLSDGISAGWRQGSGLALFIFSLSQHSRVKRCRAEGTRENATAPRDGDRLGTEGPRCSWPFCSGCVSGSG